MNDRELSRRQFLAGLSTAAKGSLIVLSLPAILTACRQANEENPTATADTQYSVMTWPLNWTPSAHALFLPTTRPVPAKPAVCALWTWCSPMVVRIN
jgi:hypothetical protein